MSNRTLIETAARARYERDKWNLVPWDELPAERRNGLIEHERPVVGAVLDTLTEQIEQMRLPSDHIKRSPYLMHYNGALDDVLALVGETTTQQVEEEP